MNIRDWSCKKCGSGWLEKIGKIKTKEGTTKDLYCEWCKQRSDFEHRIRETDDNDIQPKPSVKCRKCRQLIPNGQSCSCNTNNFKADMEAQDSKWGKHKI